MKYILIGILIACISCERKLDRVDIIKMLNSNNKDSIILGCRYVSQQKDTTYYAHLLKNPYDPRISHMLKFKGESVYQSKMKALEEITGLKAPKKITHEIDSSIVLFYKNRISTFSK